MFLAGGAGLVVLARNGAREEYLALGLASLVLGLFAVIGLVIAHAETGRVTWGAPGVWVWIAMFAVLFVVGAGNLAQALRHGRASHERRP